MPKTLIGKLDAVPHSGTILKYGMLFGSKGADNLIEYNYRHLGTGNTFTTVMFKN
jgi:hypothetical protein